MFLIDAIKLNCLLIYVDFFAGGKVALLGIVVLERFSFNIAVELTGFIYGCMSLFWKINSSGTWSRYES